MPASIHRFDSLASTQDVLHNLAASGAPAATAVVAAEQTSGRGSRGHAWAAPRGGLWLSVLCRPGSIPAMEVLSLRVALAIADTVERVAPTASVLLKWPNDLMLLGRKAGGILCEARWQGNVLGWVAVGVGINVSNEIPAELQDRATRLATVAPGLAADHLLAPMIAAIDGAANLAGGLSTGEVDAFHRRDWLLGRHLADPVPGVADGVEPDGRLRVITADGAVAHLRNGGVVPA
jgi:BirA family transcriptional regulator, biotin operon repressor / biotin---[acetyl-CoA-carboxylase] ligase